MSRPLRGEIWWAELAPTRGAEMTKRRPVVVLSADGLGVLPLKVVAPLTGHSSDNRNRPWLVPVEPTEENGLTKSGSVDVLQIRSISTERFSARVGVLSPADLAQAAAAAALVLEIE